MCCKNILCAESGVSHAESAGSGVSPTESAGATLKVDSGAKFVPAGSGSIISQKTAPPKAISDVTPQATYSVLEFTESDIKHATNNFSTNLVLGSGGFGVVYKGKLRGTNIAVKKLTEV